MGSTGHHHRGARRGAPVASVPRALAVVLAVLALFAAGCRLDTVVTVDVGADGAGTVAVVVTADRALLERAPGAFDDLRLDDLRAGGWAVDGPAATAAGGAEVRLTKPFGSFEQAGAVIGELSGPDGPLGRFTVRRERVDDATVTWRVQGSGGLPGGLAALTDPALAEALGGSVPFADEPVGDALAMEVRVRLPGEVTAVGAEVTADGTVVFRPDLGSGAISTFTATGSVRDDTTRQAAREAMGRWRALAVYLAVVAVLAEVVLLGVWLHRRRRHHRA